MILNKKYGKLLVIDGPFKHPKHRLWLCKCDCGKEKRVATSDLTNGHVKSCGCMKKGQGRHHLEGKRFGRLLVIKWITVPNKKGTFYECMCDCGKICQKRAILLTTNQTKSCGCLLLENYKNMPSGPDSPQWKNVSEGKRIAKRSWAKFIKRKDNFQCQKCGYDIIDGLTSHHIQPLHTHPELAHDINNGICLCYNCHAIFHNIYGKKQQNKEELDEFMNNKIEDICKKYRRIYRRGDDKV